jgi:hypothetical protein
MPKNVLDNVEMGRTWTSYIAAVFGSLKSAGIWDDQMLLAGMSGIAFHFIIHNQAHITSATVYDWQNEHLAMMDRVGIHSDVYYYWNHHFMNTHEAIHAATLRRIKTSIDAGLPVVVWAPTDVLEFGILYGYDDQDQVFLCRACNEEDPDPLLYENLGRSEVPILFYQIFHSKQQVDSEKIYRDSLAFGLSEWKKAYHVNPYYASGIKAYENLIRTLQKGDYQENGLRYLLSVYAQSKCFLSQYLEHIAAHSQALKGVHEIAALYHQVGTLFSESASLAPFLSPECEIIMGIDQKVIPDIQKKIVKAKALEDRVMELLEKTLS